MDLHRITDYRIKRRRNLIPPAFGPIDFAILKCVVTDVLMAGQCSDIIRSFSSTVYPAETGL